MRKISKLLLLAFITITKINAQTLTTYSVLSTSYDRSTGTFFSLGSVDDYWFYTKMQNLTVPLNPSTIINYANAPTYVVPNSGNNTFAGIINDHSINFANNTASPGLKLVTYRTYFNIPNLPTHGYELDFTMSADDAVDNVKLNGVQKGKFLDANYNNIPGIGKPYLLNIPACDTSFRTGLNYIDVTIADAGSTIGFYGEIYLSESSAACPSEVGIKEYNQNKTFLSIFPNPANANLGFKINPASFHDIESIIIFKIYSVDGKEIKTEKINKTDLSTYVLNIESLNEGIYFISIQSGVYSQNLKFVRE
jgi:hypothetical protein